MDIVSELLEEIATTSIALSQAIDDNVKDDTNRFSLLTKANALDYDIHEIRKYLEKLNSREQNHKDT